MNYMQMMWTGAPIVGGSIFVLGVFALLTLLGIGECVSVFVEESVFVGECVSACLCLFVCPGVCACMELSLCRS
jgi:hypothetical protein